MELRIFQPGDAPTILGWAKDRAAFRRWTADRYPDFPIQPEDMIAQYGTPREAFCPLTAWEDGMIVGHMILRRPNPEDASVLRAGFVIVDDARRGQHLGSRMLRLALELARQKGAERVTLGVFTDNLPAVRCYQAAGFRADGAPELYEIDGESWECTEMTCIL